MTENRTEQKNETNRRCSSLAVFTNESKKETFGILIPQDNTGQG